MFFLAEIPNALALNWQAGFVMDGQESFILKRR
jgi:hypothetical protein